MNAIIWIIRTGSLWCELPEKYGPWHTVYNNFRKWTNEGVIAKIFKRFAPNAQETSELQIDATYIKVHQHSAGAKKGGLWERLLVSLEVD